MSRISYSRCTPVVVSSDTPRMAAAIRVNRVLSSTWSFFSRSTMTAHSSGSSSVASGTAPAASKSAPLCTSRVASPPSSRIRLGEPSPSGQRRAFSVHHQYSSSVSPFQA